MKKTIPWIYNTSSLPGNYKYQKLIRDGEFRNKSKIEKIRRGRIKNLLRYVFEHSRFYKEYYERHGIKKGDIDSIHLKDLPTIDKTIMMNNFDSIVCNPDIKRNEVEEYFFKKKKGKKLFKNKYIAMHTSGSTGENGIFVTSEHEYDFICAVNALRTTIPIKNRKVTNFIDVLNSAEPEKKEKVIYVGAIDCNYAGVSSIKYIKDKMKRRILLDINSPVEEIIEKINLIKPKTIFGYSSAIYLLAELQEQKKINIHPANIVSSADSMLPYMRDLIIKSFGIIPYNNYYTAESMAISGSCKNHHKNHLYDDIHYFEFLDDNKNPVKTGGIGTLYLTVLYKFVQPLIRYKLTDHICVDEKDCECGWTFPLIKNISGRTEEFLWFTKANGKKDFIHPLLFYGEFLIPNLKRIQFIQTGKSELLIKAVIPNNKDLTKKMIKEKMDIILKGKKLLTDVSYTIEEVDHIEIDKRLGKFKLIIPFKG